jgi:hypothetical protein
MPSNKSFSRSGRLDVFTDFPGGPEYKAKPLDYLSLGYRLIKFFLGTWYIWVLMAPALIAGLFDYIISGLFPRKEKIVPLRRKETGWTNEERVTYRIF